METPAGQYGPFRHILFCTDFSENADFAFDFAIDSARRRPGCTLTLLHVIPEPDAQFWKTYLYEVDGIDQKAKADIDAKIAAAYLPRVPPEVKLEVVIRIGKDYLSILEFAGQNDVDLIIIGRQGHTAIETMLFGNVTERIVRRARCPVLVIPLDCRQMLEERATAGR